MMSDDQPPKGNVHLLKPYKFPSPLDQISRNPQDLDVILRGLWESLRKLINNDLLMNAVWRVRDILHENGEEIVFRSECAPIEHRGDAEYWESSPEPDYDYEIKVMVIGGSEFRIAFYGANAVSTATNVVGIGKARSRRDGGNVCALDMAAVSAFDNSTVNLVVLTAALIDQSFDGQWLPGNTLTFQFLESPDTRIVITPVAVN